MIPAKRLGEGMGFFSLSQSVSMALAPAIGLAIMEAFGYRSMTLFAVGLLFAASAIASLIRYRPMERATEKQQFVPF